MKYLKSLLLVIVFVYMGSIEQASATVEDGIYTNDKTIVIPISVKAGDTLSIDYRSGATYSLGKLILKDVDGKTLHDFGYKAQGKIHTLNYTFESDFEGFIVSQSGTDSVDNRVYEIRLNDEMIFDGKKFVVGYIQLESGFIELKEVTFNSARINFNHDYLPTNYTIETMLISENGKVFEDTNSHTTHVISQLVADTNYSYIIKVSFENGEAAADMQIDFKTAPIPEVNAEVYEIKHNSARIKFNYETLPKAIKIYNEDKELLYTTNNGSYQFTKLESEKEYTFFIQYVLDDKNVTELKGVNFKTLEVSKEISNLKATAKDFRAVDLTWKNTEHDKFETVTIYRKVNEQPSIMVRMASLFSLNNTTEEYEALFQTNGTTFKDMTVAADTEYTYKVTTTIEGVETPGETVTIKTPQLQIIGGGAKETEEGDFLFSWTDPTRGNVEVYVGNELFKTVPASDLKITIPKDKMKYDLLGSPNVKLVPIDENGNPGQATKPGSGMGLGGAKMPENLTPQNVLLSGVGLLGVVGGFVLLGLVWAFMPKLIKLIRQAFLNKRGAS